MQKRNTFLILLLMMNRYGSKRNTAIQATNSTLTGTQKSLGTPKQQKKSNFQEARMLSLILRTTFHRRCRHALNMLKSKSKTSYSKLRAIQQYQSNIFTAAFQQIRLYGQSKIISTRKTQLSQINPHAVSCHLIYRIYWNKIREGFCRISSCQSTLNTRDRQIERIIDTLAGIVLRIGMKGAFRKMMIKKQQKISLRVKLEQMTNIMRKISKKNQINAANLIFFNNTNEKIKEISADSHQKQKQFSSISNDRSSLLTSQRNLLQKLKKQIDSNAVEKYHVMGEMKRVKAIKIGQCKVQIRNLQQEIKELTVDYDRNMKNFHNLQMVKQDRNILSAISSKGKGSQQKVKQLYATLYNQAEKSSYVSRTTSRFIVLVKQKFKSLISPTSNPEMKLFKDQSVAYNVYKNVQQRNLMNIFENVPVETIVISESYQRAAQENIALKDAVGSIVSYQLLEICNDRSIKNDMSELETQVHQMLDFFVEGQTAQVFLKDSQLSNMSKEVGSGMGRKKDLAKSSTMSIRSTR